MTIQAFIENIISYGLEHFKVYPGLYRGVVTRVDDPEQRGRVQAHIPSVGQIEALETWIRPAMGGAGASRGMFWPPEKGDTVYVSFARGNPSKPEVYLGGWFGFPENVTDVPPEFAYTNSVPQKRGFVTRGGHGMIFSDEPDNEYIRLFWHKPDTALETAAAVSESADRESGKFAFLEFTKTGSVQISNQNGSYIFMDAEGKAVSFVSEHGHAVTMTADGVTVADSKGNLIALDKGKMNVVVDGNVNLQAAQVNLSAGGVNLGSPANFKVPLGELLLQWLQTHTHPTGVGPSGPPIVPPPPTVLSNSVKVKQ